MDFSIICPTLENNGLNIDCELLFMAKEKPEKKEETEEQIAVRKGIRKDWGEIEPKFTTCRY